MSEGWYPKLNPVKEHLDKIGMPKATIAIKTFPKGVQPQSSQGSWSSAHSYPSEHFSALLIFHPVWGLGTWKCNLKSFQGTESLSWNSKGTGYTQNTAPPFMCWKCCVLLQSASNTAWWIRCLRRLTMGIWATWDREGNCIDLYYAIVH